MKAWSVGHPDVGFVFVRADSRVKAKTLHPFFGEDGFGMTEVETRQEVYDILDAMAAPERHTIRVVVDWRDDDGDYVYHLLRGNVEP